MADQESDYLLGTAAVTPQSVYSEKELVKTFEDLLVTLSNKDHDFWQKRSDALRSIRSLVIGGAADYDCFMSCLLPLKTPIAEAVADLRSTLVREACATVALLSQTFGNGFASMGEFLIPAILKQIPVTIQVISEAANLSLRALLRHTHSPRLLPTIIQSAVGKGRSPVLRARCIEYVLVVLELWAWQDFEKHADKIEEVIVQGLADAQPDVRAGARRCVIELCQSYQARGERILRALDSQTQKKIFEESERGAPRPNRSRTSLKPPSLSGTTANGGSTGGTPVSGGGGGYLGSKPPSSRGGEGGQSTGATRTKSMEGRNACGPDGTSALAQPQSAPHSAATGLEAPRRLGRAKSLGGAELENLKHSIQVAASEGLIPQEKAKAIGRGPQRVLAAAAADADMQGSPRRRRGNHGPAVAGLEDGPGAGEGKGGRLSEDDLVALVAKCGNNLWSLRESSLLELTAQVKITPPSRALLSQAPKVVDVAAERVSDAHYKVQQAALSLLLALASHLAACLSPQLDSILRQMLPRLVDKKEQSRTACVALLDALYHFCGPQNMVASMNKAMDGAPGAVKVAALEHLTADLRLLAPLMASSPSLARALLGHALPLCGDRVLDVKRGACVVAVQLRALAPLALYESLAKPWPPGQLAAVKKGLMQSLPNLDRELAVFLRTKKLDPQVAAEANQWLAAALSSKPPRSSGNETTSALVLTSADGSCSRGGMRPSTVGDEGVGGRGVAEDGCANERRQRPPAEESMKLQYAPEMYEAASDDMLSSDIAVEDIEQVGEDDAEEVGLRQTSLNGHHAGFEDADDASDEHEVEQVLGVSPGMMQLRGRGDGEEMARSNKGRREGWTAMRSECGQKSSMGSLQTRGSDVGQCDATHDRTALAWDQERAHGRLRDATERVVGLEDRVTVVDTRQTGVPREKWAFERRQNGGEKGRVQAGARGAVDGHTHITDEDESRAISGGAGLVAAGERRLSRAIGAVAQARVECDVKQLHVSLDQLFAVCKSVPKTCWIDAAGSDGEGGMVVRMAVVVLDVIRAVDVIRAAAPGAELVDGDVLGKVLSVLDWTVSSLGEEEDCQTISHLIVEALLERLCKDGTVLARTTINKMDEIIGRLMTAGHPDRGLGTLSAAVSRVEAPALQVATKLLGKLAAASPPAIVESHLPHVLPPLFRAFAHPHADVRKSVVFCLVDLYRVLGELLMPHLDQGLSTSQLKLVTIYINRLQT